MNKVITVNLNGAAYQLEEDGYEALRSYLDSAARRLEGNPDKSEIMADIEQAIADRCRAVLGSYKTVVTTREIGTIVAEMGPVEDASGQGSAPPPRPGGAPRPAPEGGGPRGPRRLFRIREGRMLGGVCNGIAAYLGVDVTLIRLIFVVLGLITFGAAAVAYFILLIVVPLARTPAEKAAATGEGVTALEFIRRAKAGYYEGMRTFSDKHAHREWRRRFREEMRDWRRAFRREMRATVHPGWCGWGGGPAAAAVLAVILPVFLVLRALLVCLLLCALVSLLATGAVFGVLLPAALPMWAGIVILFVVYQMVSWPLKAVHHAYAWTGRDPGRALLGAWEACVWLAFVAFLLWLGWHHAAQVREAVANVPVAIHDAVAAVERWWRRR